MSSWIAKVKSAILPIWKDRSDEHEDDPDPSSRRDLDLAALESAPFQKLVVFVAGLGFFTDGYMVSLIYGQTSLSTNLAVCFELFASNFALPILGYLYWHDDKISGHETAINATTLAGSFVGQVVLGVLADRYGRRRLYGWELTILIFGSTGVALVSQGYQGSMDITALLIFGRFVVGSGIGAEYPTTAVITSEFAPTQFRARMLASVFAMQSFGQLFAAGVSLITLRIGTNYDSKWRWIYGVGSIPAGIVLLLRRYIPESPRYTFDIQRNPRKANAAIAFSTGTSPKGASDMSFTGEAVNSSNGHDGPQHASGPSVQTPRFPPLASREDFHRYLLDNGNWRYLLATAGSWFLVDLSFYGLGLNVPQIVSKIYNSPTSNTTIPYTWDSEPDKWEHPTTVFQDNAVHSLVIVSIPAVMGSLSLIWIVNHVSRKRLQIGGFFLLAAFFFVIGAILDSLVSSMGPHTAVAVMYGVSQFLFNLGPNGLTFMFPAEIFPTRYRCTCHGLSAAAGKLGSAVALASLRGAQFTRTTQGSQSPALGRVLIGFGCAMVLGGLLSFLLPEVQNKRHESKTLEELAQGREASEPQQINATEMDSYSNEHRE